MNIHYLFITNIILSVYVFEMMLYCCMNYIANLWLVGWLYWGLTPL